MSVLGSLDAGLDRGALRAAYSRFLEGDRILLTGHSHQAWPDAARDALLRYFDDAAALVDDKWGEVVMPKCESVGARILERMGLPRTDPIALGRSTHELVFRLLTCLPLHQRPRIVTTTGEFHSLYRQLARLAEEGVEVVWVPAEPREGLRERLVEAIVPGTAMVAFSAVLFEDAYVLPGVGDVVARARDVGALALVDAYHAFNVVPIDWGRARDHAFVTAGGYKYAAFGEGLCWLRIPPGCELRPLDTGWFADFGALTAARTGVIGYGAGGARFAGATFDGAAVYRAEAALDHWDRFGLDLARLRAISTCQTREILSRLDEAGLSAAVVSARDDARRGGFVTLRVPNASDVVARLRARRVLVDARGERLRLGPAPYITDDEIARGVAAVAAELKA